MRLQNQIRDLEGQLAGRGGLLKEKETLIIRIKELEGLLARPLFFLLMKENHFFQAQTGLQGRSGFLIFWNTDQKMEGMEAVAQPGIFTTQAC